LEDLFEMRAALLGLASRRLAERAGPSDLRELRAGLGALESSVNDASQYARASSAMVATISRLSQNEQLANYIAEFSQRFGRYARLGLASQDRRKKSLSHWRKLVAVISKGDAALAESLHRALALENLAAGLAEIEKREAGSK
jgi:DNA-binding GntR family transcriptional regulator